MECKFVCAFNISAIEKRINRYIMECKSFDDLDTGWDRCGINRYIMECKWSKSGKE
mgnify:FL=1